MANGLHEGPPGRVRPMRWGDQGPAYLAAAIALALAVFAAGIVAGLR